MLKIYNQALINSYSKEKLDNELILFYNQWKKRYLRTVENTYPHQEYLFYTLDQPMANNAVTCSEAMGYGMVIFPIMSKFDSSAKNHFLHLYNFIKSYPSIYDKNLMAWQQIKTPEGKIVNAEKETSSATDGDMDISYGLLLGDKLWGNVYELNCKEEALKRISALMDSCIDKRDYIITLGDWVKFIENNNFKNVTRSSDFMQHHIKEFIKVDTKNKVSWQKVLSRIDSIISDQLKKQSKTNGLMPDFFIKVKNSYIAPTTKILESNHDGDYFFNSCRTPWRYSMEILFNNVPITKQISTLNNWIKKETTLNSKNIKSGYYLANGSPGTPFGESNNLAFISPFLVSSLTENNNEEWTINLWQTILNKPMEECNFYENTLKLISMIIVTGNWIIPSSN